MAGTPPPRQENLFDDSDGETEASKEVPRASLPRSNKPESGSRIDESGVVVEVCSGSGSEAVNQEMRDPLEVDLPTKQPNMEKVVVQGRGLHGMVKPRAIPL